LSVGDVDAREIHSIRVAHFKDAILSIVRHVVRDTDTIECVPAETSRVGPSRVANLDRGDISANKHVPLLNLLDSSVIGTKMCGVQQCTHRISVQILPMGIKFTTVVLGVDVDICLIRESDDLHVVCIIEYLNASDGTTRN